MSEVVPPLVAYSKYRIVISRIQEQNGNLSYAALREVGLFSASNATGTNLATGSITSASSSYSGGYPPENTIDGNIGTYWESGAFSAGSATVWIRFDLPEAAVVRSVRMAGGYANYANETPMDFVIQGSNDGDVWTDLVDIISWGGFIPGFKPFLIDANVRMDLAVMGTSRLATGERSDSVFIHSYASGELLRKLTPAANGSYTFAPQTLDGLLITHIGPTGYAPQADGPVIPAER